MTLPIEVDWAEVCRRRAAVRDAKDLPSRLQALAEFECHLTRFMQAYWPVMARAVEREARTVGAGRT